MKRFNLMNDNDLLNIFCNIYSHFTSYTTNIAFCHQHQNQYYLQKIVLKGYSGIKSPSSCQIMVTI